MLTFFQSISFYPQNTITADDVGEGILMTSVELRSEISVLCTYTSHCDTEDASEAQRTRFICLR